MGSHDGPDLRHRDRAAIAHLLPRARLPRDSGYIPRLAIFSDRLFRAMGLNGKAVLPMVLGLGCDTMATMTTRILGTPKERLIAITLLALGVPCSAQLATIMGILGGISVFALLTLFAVVLSQMVLVGFLAARALPGDRSDFILELRHSPSPLGNSLRRRSACAGISGGRAVPDRHGAAVRADRVGALEPSSAPIGHGRVAAADAAHVFAARRHAGGWMRWRSGAVVGRRVVALTVMTPSSRAWRTC
jgi:hypothetical protein